jgi:ubiquinone/menaquinone biosynthesis C-methylase UbiE
MKKSLSVEDYERAFRPARRGFQISLPHEAAIFHLGAARGDRVLDLGCGMGELLSLLAASGARTVGIDYSSEALAVARASLPARPILRGDVTSLPFPPSSFERAAALGVLGFLSPADLRMALEECARVLRPGGVLVICTGAPLNHIGSLLLALRAGQWRRKANSRSHIYPASLYRRELERLGFSVTTWRAWYGAPRTWRGRILHPFFAPRWFRASLRPQRAPEPDRPYD